MNNNPTRFYSALCFSIALTLASLVSGCAQPSARAEPLCEASSHVFCRCAGGEAGTKQCAPDGASFSVCGPCDGQPGGGSTYPPKDPPSGIDDDGAPPNPGSGDGSGDGNGSGNGSGNGDGSGDGNGNGSGDDSGNGNGNGSGNGTPSGGTKALFESCTQSADCASGDCRSGYCTTSCQKVSDCPYPAGECVLSADDVTVCMPVCQSASDCTPFDAPSTQCGHSNAIDSFSVSACASWGTKHAIRPYGADCTPLDHKACNLGYDHREIVCSAEGICAKGCFVNKDCPEGQLCSAQGSLGTCQ